MTFDLSGPGRRPLEGWVKPLHTGHSVQRTDKREVTRLGKAPRTPSVPKQVDASNLRFRADGFRGHRERLGVTVREMATLLRVSVQSVTNWESGSTAPSASHLERIAAVRKMGKRDVAKLLAPQETQG